MRVEREKRERERGRERERKKERGERELASQTWQLPRRTGCFSKGHWQSNGTVGRWHKHVLRPQHL